MLQNAGFIAYSRGRMRLLDIPGLVRGSCECLELMERQMDRIFAKPWREMVRKEDETVDFARRHLKRLKPETSG